jgi:flagellar protein FlgJ
VLGGGQTEFYQDLFDQQMALHLSSGKGLGLSEVLVRQMIGTQDGATPAGRDFSDYQPVTALARDLSETRRPSGASASPVATGAQAFVDRIRPHAERAARALGVPAEAIMAQAALETGWGRHVPQHADGRPSFNFFGIKADAGWDGARLQKPTYEVMGGRLQSVNAAFRSYDSIGEAFDDYARFLQSNPRYADALRQGSDGEAFARGLQDAGYATDPAYADKLLKLMGGATISRAGDSTDQDSLA